ncbi:alpha/beta hydrolase fold [Trichodesmium erythraeum IMS101]|uniref:Alpha/beta hydrolase fold n=1 Tax=Trichodesmium erythraeum (strain IMS101) TaxID=203124 RepID=Q110G6_TRIEI|nr:alpha/beta fold hydrolase [Trichodesmium erythraeum GBRTRLIN201]
MNVITSNPTLDNQLRQYNWSWKNHNIQYTMMGTGQPLLLTHGFGASINHWRNNIPLLAKSGYQVFALDLLGFGASSKPSIDYSMELWEELIYDFWSAHIRQPTVFVGNSIGALLSLMILASYPEIATGGILINCAGGLNHRPQELNLPLRFIMGMFTKLVSSPVLGPFIFNQVRQKHRIRNTLKQVYINKEAVTEELVEIIHRPSCDAGAQKVFASILTAPAGPHPSELLPKIKAPLLVIWGEKDPWTPISGAQIYQDLADKSGVIQFEPIPNTGHCAHDERPTIVNSLILDWLAKMINM